MPGTATLPAVQTRRGGASWAAVLAVAAVLGIGSGVTIGALTLSSPTPLPVATEHLVPIPDPPAPIASLPAETRVPRATSTPRATTRTSSTTTAARAPAVLRDELPAPSTPPTAPAPTPPPLDDEPTGQDDPTEPTGPVDPAPGEPLPPGTETSQEGQA